MTFHRCVLVNRSLGWFVAALAWMSDGVGQAVDRVSFSRDVQPIFARACTSCHGGVKQAADISFITADAILPPDGWIVEPGKPDASLLFARITSTDPDERMPPPEEHPNPLTDVEIDTIRRWIEQGAHWEPSWSMARLEHLAIPVDSSSQAWSLQPLDHFVFRSLMRAGLSPAEEAEPAQWLRRVTFDLTGLPPTHLELQEFYRELGAAVDKEARQAVYARRVDGLLSSTHFGEKWASMWMDLARYADSKGFEKDPHRDIWPYRDWLVKAFNSDMPYDEFTIRQLAGDLLPGADYADLIATAFHRNTQTNTEGGTDDEEYRVAAVIDRVNTTWTVWQASTFGCTQCHAHPYEPFRNVEYYQCMDLFNSTEDVDLDSEFPTIPWLEDGERRGAYSDLVSKLERKQEEMDGLGRLLVEQANWQPLPIDSARATSGQLGISENEVYVAAGTVAKGSQYTLECEPDKVAALRLTILPNSDKPSDWPEQGSVLSQLELSVVKIDGTSRTVTLDAVIPDYRAGPYACEDVLKKGTSGFGGYPKLFRPRWCVVTLAEPLGLQEGERLQLVLHQDASVTGGLSNHLRRFTLEFCGKTIWNSLGNRAEGLSDAYVSYGRMRDEVNRLSQSLAEFRGANVPVVRDRVVAARRETRQFIRGNWLDRGEVVDSGIPKVFGGEAGVPVVTNRLEFAEWLVSEQNPLAARVWANRIWAELFGIGIVETLEDFGASGLPPTHPELLEHLAIKMQKDFSWRLKPFIRSIVLSATYRQDSRVTKSLWERDPRNRLLARGPRTRLTAEMIRDQALVASGKLQRQLGGPSVMPPQPDGVWQQVYSGEQWKTSTDESRFRRGLYTYWKRTSPYPGMVAFDAPSRDVCSPRRIPTNTPLQALVTLNSEVYQELAAALADRVCRELPQHASPVEAIQLMFELVASQRPTDGDVIALRELYKQLGGTDLWQFASTDRDVQTAIGDQQTAVDIVQSASANTTPQVATTSLASDAMAGVALAILNSDWALTK